MRLRKELMYFLVLVILPLVACDGGMSRVLPSATPPYVLLVAQTPMPPLETLAPVPTSTATLAPSPVYTSTPLPTQTPTILPVLREPCISYYDATQGDLKFVCRRFDDYWRPIQTVDAEGNVGLFSSLVFDAQSRAHIAYYAMDSGDLKYARQTGAGWLVETVDSAGDTGWYPSMAIRYDGHVFISYYDRDQQSVRVAQREAGAAWNIMPIEKVGPLESEPSEIYTPAYPDQFRTSIGIDPRGYPIVSYIGNLAKNLKVAWWDGKEWEIKLVDPAAPSGGFNSLAFSPQGYPAISYHDIEQGTLRYAWWDGHKWLTETVHHRGTNIGLFTSLVFDSLGRPHISYFDDDPDTLFYAVRRNDAWIIESMTPGLYRPGFFSSIALDQQDRPMIAYYEFNEGDLCVAAWDGRTFQRSFVDVVGSVGWYPSLRFRPVYP